MSITSHAALGAVIALSVKNPVIVLPLSLISHFVLDVLPHFGYPGHPGYGYAFKQRLTKLYILSDIIFGGLLVWAIIGAPRLAYIAAGVAVLPDFFNATTYFFLVRKGRKPLFKRFTKFHRSIQWGHNPWGILVEIATAVLLISLVRELK